MWSLGLLTSLKQWLGTPGYVNTLNIILYVDPVIIRNNGHCCHSKLALQWAIVVEEG